MFKDFPFSAFALVAECDCQEKLVIRSVDDLLQVHTWGSCLYVYLYLYLSEENFATRIVFLNFKFYFK